MKPIRAKADAATPAHAISELRRRNSNTRRARVKKPTKRERVMLAFDDAVQALTPGPQFSALKGNLMYALHQKWSMARKIEFFERFAADARRLAR